MDHIVVINNKKIAYSDEGRGQVIVFLHGWMSNKSAFEGIIKELSDSYRCISIDLPGFGKSDSMPKKSVRDIPIVVNKLIKHIGIAKFYLVGNSLGGAISILYAKRYPEKIRKMVLMSPFVNFKQFSKLMYFLLRYVIPYVIHRKIISPIFKIIKLSADLLEGGKLDRKTLKYLRRQRVKRRAVYAFKIAYQLSSMDLYKILRGIRKDILLVYGTKDNLLSLIPLEPLFGVLTNLHLAIFEDVRHYVFSFPTDKLAEKITLFFQTTNKN